MSEQNNGEIDARSRASGDGLSHECSESAADEVVLSPGDECPFCDSWSDDSEDTSGSEQTKLMTDGDRVVLDLEEARRVANSLEMLYYDTKESAYDATDEQAALDAMAIRERGGIEPNPELLERPADTDGEIDG